jgi:DNA polymerase-3 subunit gamma/tau
MQSRLLKGIEMANDCDLYKVSQNQRLLVELCLMQLASITLMEKKKDQFIIPPTYFKRAITLFESPKVKLERITINPIAAATQEKEPEVIVVLQYQLLLLH